MPVVQLVIWATLLVVVLQNLPPGVAQVPNWEAKNTLDLEQWTDATEFMLVGEGGCWFESRKSTEASVCKHECRETTGASGC